MTTFDAIVYFLFGILVLLLLFGLLVWLIRFVDDFSGELRYLNTEIQRTRGTQRRYWIRRRRQLWLSLLPFFRY